MGLLEFDVQSGRGFDLDDLRRLNGLEGEDCPVRVDQELLVRAVDVAVRAVLGTQVKLGELCALMGELGERFLGSRENVFVVDRERRLVLHADPARVAAREDLSRHGLFAALSVVPAARPGRDGAAGAEPPLEVLPAEPADVGAWVVHAGGPKVLDAVESFAASSLSGATPSSAQPTPEAMHAQLERLQMRNLFTEPWV